MQNPFAKLPPWGKFAVVGGAGAVIVFAYYQHRQSASSATSTSTDTTVDPATGLPYSEDGQVDPGTGMTYSAEVQEYGSVQAAESALGSSDTASYGYPYSGGGYSDYYPTSDTTSTYTYGSNAEWAQAVEGGLSDIGWSTTDVASALGRYLGGLSLTPDQANIVQAALAEYGNPPVGTYQIIPAPSSSTGSSSGTQVSGLRVAKVNPATHGNNGSVQIEWNQLSGATSYTVYMESKGSFTTDRTVANEGSLSPGHHEIAVTPEPGGKSTSVSFTIPKAHGWRA